MWQKNRFIKYFGVIGIFGPVVIFTFYTYVESWLLGYSVFAITGKYAGCTDSTAMADFLCGYQGLVHNEHFSGIATALSLIHISIGWARPIYVFVYLLLAAMSKSP